LLKAEHIDCGYEDLQVLFDVSLNIEAGEIVAIIGPNGSGKSTLLKALYGLLSIWEGKIFFEGKPVQKLSVIDRIKAGLSFSPQGNRVFDELNVYENLEIGGFLLPKKERNERIDLALDIFPSLKDKLPKSAGNLSGGEQQILALARVLVTKPKILLLDEPSLGLAPNLISDLFDHLKQINQEQGITILIVEQKVREVMQFADRLYAIRLGKVAWEGRPDDLKDDKERLRSIFL
jgi:branched-chain amino acid transport system ATP-binding protein